MICVLAFSNYMFQFVIPFNKHDKYLNPNKVQLPIFPTMPGMRLPGQAPNVKPHVQVIDLTGEISISRPNTAFMNTESSMEEISLDQVPEHIKK